MPNSLNHLLAGVAVLACAAPLMARAETLNDAVVAADGPATQAVTKTPDPQSQASPDAYTVSQISTGGNVLSRMFDYYKLEWGKAAAPADPNALPSRRDDYPPQPEPQPPYPFTEWPYGAASLLGASRPNSVDSPLMVGLAPTPLGKWMQDAYIQAYGWVEVGANVSTSHGERRQRARRLRLQS